MEYNMKHVIRNPAERPGGGRSLGPDLHARVSRGVRRPLEFDS